MRELLAEGSFHVSSVEEVAARAGVSRATLYQHFRSRLELVDAMCEAFDENPALLRLRETVALADPDQALVRTISGTVRFWSAEDGILRGLTAPPPSTRPPRTSSIVSAPTAARSWSDLYATSHAPAGFGAA